MGGGATGRGSTNKSGEASWQKAIPVGALVCRLKLLGFGAYHNDGMSQSYKYGTTAVSEKKKKEPKTPHAAVLIL